MRRPVFIGDFCALVGRQRILDEYALAEGEELDSNILSQDCEAFRVGSLTDQVSCNRSDSDSFGLLSWVCHVGARRTSSGHLNPAAQAMSRPRYRAARVGAVFRHASLPHDAVCRTCPGYPCDPVGFPEGSFQKQIIVDGIEDRSGVGKKFANPVDHQAFQIAGRYPPAARTVPSRPGEEGGRNIVPISSSLLGRIGWHQAPAGLVKNRAGQQAGVACAHSRCPLDAVCSKHCLDIVPQRLVDNRCVFSGIGIAFVCYIAAVKPVLNNKIKCPTGELLAPIRGAVGPHSALALDPGVSKFFPKRVNRLEREIVARPSYARPRLRTGSAVP